MKYKLSEKARKPDFKLSIDIAVLKKLTHYLDLF